MRIEPGRKLFVGVRIDNRLRDALANCAPRDKAMFDGTDPRYLTVLRSPDYSYLGKIIDAGCSSTAMEDLKRNIQSLMARLGGRRTDDDIKIFVCAEGDAPVIAADPEDHPVD